VSERLAQIVASMRLRPDDRVLEIGCGHGVAAAYIGAQLVSGHLIALDRSAKMIAAARRRNRALIAAGKVELVTIDFERFEPGRRRFDKILAVRVRALHGEDSSSRRLVERWLAPRGKLVVVYDEP
jgi:cyclopropane fatty-acyl-phospholipid synthase-like methyltransferase